MKMWSPPSGRIEALFQVFLVQVHQPIHSSLSVLTLNFVLFLGSHQGALVRIRHCTVGLAHFRAGFSLKSNHGISRNRGRQHTLQLVNWLLATISWLPIYDLGPEELLALANAWDLAILWGCHDWASDLRISLHHVLLGEVVLRTQLPLLQEAWRLFAWWGVLALSLVLIQLANAFLTGETFLAACLNRAASHSSWAYLKHVPSRWSFQGLCKAFTDFRVAFDINIILHLENFPSGEPSWALVEISRLFVIKDAQISHCRCSVIIHMQCSVFIGDSINLTDVFIDVELWSLT